MRRLAQEGAETAAKAVNHRACGGKSACEQGVIMDQPLAADDLGADTCGEEAVGERQPLVDEGIELREPKERGRRQAEVRRSQGRQSRVTAVRGRGRVGVDVRREGLRLDEVPPREPPT